MFRFIPFVYSLCYIPCFCYAHVAIAGNDNLHGLNLTPPETGAATRPPRQAAATGTPAPAPRTTADAGGGRFPGPPPAPVAQLPGRHGNIPIPPADPTLQDALCKLAMWKAQTEALVRTALQTGNLSKEAKKPVLPDVVPGHKASVLDSTRESNPFYHTRFSRLHDKASRHHVLSMLASYDACFTSHLPAQRIARALRTRLPIVFQSTKAVQ